ncbi:MAG: hypothetical protein FD130_2614, partial [Halothiobacillaceae bacterium]
MVRVKPPPSILMPPAKVEVAVEVAEIEAKVGVEVPSSWPELFNARTMFLSLVEVEKAVPKVKRPT